MAAPTIADRVALLVEDLTDKVIEALGMPNAASSAVCDAGVRHVLTRELAKVVSNYLMRAGAT